jgi:hypothetical protein
VQRFTGGKGGDFTVAPAGRAAFRYGLNRIDVVAVRKKLPKRQRCNAGARSQANGISLSLAATFRSNLSRRLKPDPKYFVASDGKSFVFTFNVGTFNHGPSYAVEGAIALELGIGNDASIVFVEATSAGAPYGPCTVTLLTANKRYAIFCPFADWRPSDAASEVQVKIGVRLAEPLPPSFRQTSLLLGWDVAPGHVVNDALGPSDADPDLHTALSDNHSAAVSVLCGKNADDPGCKTATAPPAANEER